MSMLESPYINFCKRFGALKQFSVKDSKPSQVLVDSLSVLHWDVTPEQIVTSTRFLTLATFIFFFALTLISLVIGWNPFYFGISAIVLPLVANQLFTDYPKNKAKLKILEALGEAPKVLVYLVVLLKQNPHLEEALRFSAEFGEGEVANDLKRALWDSWSGKAKSVKEQFPLIGEKWGRFSPDFKRAIYLIRASMAERYETRRLSVLDKSLDAALSGITSKTRDYVQSLFIPSLILFSFGTVLPLMLISMMPIASYLGVGFITPVEVSLFLLATIAAIYLYSNNILMKRPPTFSRPTIPKLDHLPADNEFILFGRKIPALPFGFAFVLLIGFPGIFFLLSQSPLIVLSEEHLLAPFFKEVNSLTLIWAIGLAVSIIFYGQAAPRVKIRNRIVQIEKEVLDALYQLAHRMGEGRPAEEALGFVADTMTGSSISAIFHDASKLIKRRNVTLEAAFFDNKFGTLRDVYSSTVRSMMTIFTMAAKKGSKVSSEVLFTMVSHFSEKAKIEDELSNMMKRSISMLRTTVVIFAPLICGIVVTLHQIIQNALASAQEELLILGYQQNFLADFLVLQTSTFSVEILQLIVGVYLLLLGIVLIRYTTIIENGLDEVEIKLQIAKSLPISLAVFTIVMLLSRNLLGG